MSDVETPETPSDPLAEELTAYLDGELTGTDRAQVEERLARDPSYRARLHELQGAWDLLDQLPQAETNDTFTRSTVELVAVQAADEARTEQLAVLRGRHRGWLAAVGIAIASLGLGYWSTTLAGSRPDARLVQDLAAIENVDVYRHAGSLGFLRDLEATGLFADVPEGAADASLVGGAVPVSDTAATPSDRYRAVRDLPPERKEELRQKQTQFLALSADEQKNLRALSVDLGRNENASLRQTAVRYTQWLKTLGPAERSELLSLPLEQRIGQIKKLVKEQQDRQLKRHAPSRLAAADLPVIYAWFEQFMIEHETEFFGLLTPRGQEVVRGEKDPARRRVILMMAALQASPDKAREKLSGMVGPDNRQKLQEKLSPEAQKELLAAKEPWQRGLLLRDWTRAAIASRLPDDALFERSRFLFGWNPPVSREELQRFLASDRISSKERERLESLPPDKMDEELRALYHQQRWRQSGEKFGGGPRSFGSDDHRRPEGRPPPDEAGKGDSASPGPSPNGNPPPRRGPGSFRPFGKGPPPDESKGDSSRDEPPRREGPPGV